MDADRRPARNLQEVNRSSSQHLFSDLRCSPICIYICLGAACTCQRLHMIHLSNCPAVRIRFTRAAHQLLSSESFSGTLALQPKRAPSVIGTLFTDAGQGAE